MSMKWIDLRAKEWDVVLDMKLWKSKIFKGPVQSKGNNEDCGVFVMMAIRAIVRCESMMFSESQMPKYRRDIAYELLLEGNPSLLE